MINVEQDDRLRAVVRRAMPLRYAAGADPSLDRPAHVRAGSGLCRVAGRLVVVQDDAAFVALIDPATAEVVPITLPVEDGVRQWDEGRGNKRLKPDLEACVAIGPDAMLALGSGSTPERERLLLVTGIPGRPDARWIHAPGLYAALREAKDFSGSELNIEGAVVAGDRLRLFNRGNGAPADPLRPIDATCDLPLDALLEHLSGGPAPHPIDIVQYELGQLGGARLGFTDATTLDGEVLFSAAAEASPDSYRDGPVTGSAIGVLGLHPGWTPLLNADGTTFTGKVEGITAADGRTWVVIDRDDPASPSELCEVELRIISR